MLVRRYYQVLHGTAAERPGFERTAACKIRPKSAVPGEHVSQPAANVPKAVLDEAEFKRRS